jgi:hypothetical protein
MRCADRGPRARRAAICGLLALAVASSGCRTSSAPLAAVTSVQRLPERVSGMWVRVTTSSGTVVNGELIAAMHDSLFVIDAELQTVPRDAIREVELTRYTPQYGPIAAWVLAGTASTLSHGFFLLFTAPAWLTSGIAAGAAESRRAILHTTDFTELARYARFPGGLPSTVDRRQLRSAIR